MNARLASGLAWSVGALTLALAAATSVLAVLNHAGSGNLSYSILGISMVVVGGVVASKQPANPIGWLFLGSALSSTFRTLAAEYVVYGVVTDPGALPLVRTLAGFSNAIEVIGPVLVFVLVPLYFPNGRPVSRRWGIVAWLALGLLPVMTIFQAVSTGEAVYGFGIPNPWAVEALRPVTETLEPVGFVYYIGLIFASAASLVVRFWRSRGEERQQIKWLAFAAALIPIWFVSNGPIDRAFPALFAVLDALVIAGVPVAAGIAILRYRLYDIDVIINRTLVYGALTVTLVLVYLGGVVGGQSVFRALTGGESQLAVVASTLAIAALFTPLRRRIHALIDRRFYRRRYDAARTLETFSARLRDETDLDTLSGDLTSVVRETLQPEHAALWLRPPSARSRDV
ncbi:MAG TPA: hypothetical protein VK869_14895 [Rubrobacteraceae bacterium]|nr:hypothetical protein [Rubrobacteraceae bacterium]